MENNYLQSLYKNLNINKLFSFVLFILCLLFTSCNKLPDDLQTRKDAINARQTELFEQEKKASSSSDYEKLVTDYTILKNETITLISECNKRGYGKNWDYFTKDLDDRIAKYENLSKSNNSYNSDSSSNSYSSTSISNDSSENEDYKSNQDCTFTSDDDVLAYLIGKTFREKGGSATIRFSTDGAVLSGTEQYQWISYKSMGGYKGYVKLASINPSHPDGTLKLWVSCRENAVTDGETVLLYD